MTQLKENEWDLVKKNFLQNRIQKINGEKNHVGEMNENEIIVVIAVVVSNKMIIAKRIKFLLFFHGNKIWSVCRGCQFHQHFMSKFCVENFRIFFGATVTDNFSLNVGETKWHLFCQIQYMYSAHRLIESLTIESAAYCNKILLVPLYLNSTRKKTSVNWIIQFNVITFMLAQIDPINRRTLYFCAFRHLVL